MNVATIISYCTHDYRFIGKCIDEAKKFSNQIIVPLCDHFYNGSPENRYLLERTYAEHPEVQFIEFAYDANRFYSPYLTYTNNDLEAARIWCTTSRYIGFLYLKPEIEYVLFLDCDEIMEGDRFAKWLKTKEHEKFSAMRLCCYYYILRPTLRAKLFQELPLFARRKAFHSLHFIHPDDRYALFQSIPGSKGRNIIDGTPFLHHYSWVRPMEENIHKGATWGHQNDCDWNTIIRNSFAGKKIQEFFGVDFDFEEIETPYFDPLSIQVPSGKASGLSYDHVKKVDHRTIMKKQLAEVLEQNGG